VDNLRVLPKSGVCPLAGDRGLARDMAGVWVNAEILYICEFHVLREIF